MLRRFVGVVTLCSLLLGSNAMSAQTGPRMTPRLHVALTNGSLVRTVSEVGLALGLEGFLGGDAVLLWPGDGPVRGADSILARLTGASWLDSTGVGWAPLRIHDGGDPSLVLSLSVLSLAGRMTDGRIGTRFGRLMMVWEGDTTRMQLRAMMISNIGVPVLAPIDTTRRDSTAIVTAGWRPGPADSALARADSAFRDDLERDGPSAAFGKWAAPLAITTGHDGLNLGPEELANSLRALDSVSTWRMRPREGGASVSGNVGWVSGLLTIHDRRQAGTGATGLWNYMLFWERQTDGRYRITAAATNPWRSNSDDAAPGARGPQGK